MPVHDSCKLIKEHPAFFESLEELDVWAANPSEKLGGVLKYHERRPVQSGNDGGKLLVCHDYKGGYKETPFALSYTFNYWSSVDVFVYFAHHRVTIPPPGWISAAHRQGVKILGTLIFEWSAEEDSLRLLVGKPSRSSTGPALPAVLQNIPLSSHYARLLAQLAQQRCFDGYLLNFECPLRGEVEQAKALTAWVTLLRHELRVAVGPHAQTIWYDSVLYTGVLRWQDRLNYFNLPFFLSSTAFFTNYTWPLHYPHLNAQYFLSAYQALWSAESEPRGGITYASKSLQDIFMGVDVWGRGCHGGGGYGSYKAISHIDPQSIGLSVALFGQAWTWESEQDRPNWTWEEWWDYERKLWAGPSKTEVVHIPDCPQEEGQPRCSHGSFQPISAFFSKMQPPEPSELAFHTTFSPGVGRSWHVEGRRVWHSANGWTDIDKQCSMGNMMWPSPASSWEGIESVDALPNVSPSVCLDDSWNGGSCLRLDIASQGFDDEDSHFRCLWIPIQSLTVTMERCYEARFVYKLGTVFQADVDIGLSVKVLSKSSDYEVHITDVISQDNLPYDWTGLTIQFSLAMRPGASPPVGSDILVAVGLLAGVAPEQASDAFSISLFLGQLNVFPATPKAAVTYQPLLTWADFLPSHTVARNAQLSGILTWDTAITFVQSTNNDDASPEDPVPVWKLNISGDWYPRYLYFNIYIQAFTFDGQVADPYKAAWLGTTGLDGRDRRFVVDVPVTPSACGTVTQVRLYVQGMDDHGNVLPWNRCVFVDVQI